MNYNKNTIVEKETIIKILFFSFTISLLITTSIYYPIGHFSNNFILNKITVLFEDTNAIPNQLFLLLKLLSFLLYIFPVWAIINSLIASELFNKFNMITSDLVIYIRLITIILALFLSVIVYLFFGIAV